VIGLKVALPGGALVEFGGKVMKNVAGYDAAKLFLGAWGTLGVLVEVTFRLWPFPPEEAELRSGPPDLSWLSSPIHRQIKRIFDPLELLL
jgi:glycolate oxidase FAD binding subunit